jgi:hypothetical protein
LTRRDTEQYLPMKIIHRRPEERPDEERIFKWAKGKCILCSHFWWPHSSACWLSCQDINANLPGS